MSLTDELYQYSEKCIDSRPQEALAFALAAERIEELEGKLQSLRDAVLEADISTNGNVGALIFSQREER